MPPFLTIASLVLLIAAVILHVMGWRRLGGWLLAPFPALLCGAASMSYATYHGNLEVLVERAVLLLLALLAALLPRWRWLFWIAWACNFIMCGTLVYLVYMAPF